MMAAPDRALTADNANAARARPGSARVLAYCAVALSGAGLALALGWREGASPVESWQLATRYTARFASLTFLGVYLARPMYDLTRSRSARAWRALRRTHGLAFATATGVHLLAVAVYLLHGGKWPRPLSLAYLMLAVVVLTAMTVTSTRAAQRGLGRAWRALHKAGIHVLWLAFTFGHLTMLSRDAWAAAPFFLLAVAAGALRALAWMRRRSARAGMRPELAPEPEPEVRTTT